MLTSLKALLRGAARTLGVERAANAALIEEMWAEVVGPAAAAHSRILGMRGTVVLAEAEAGPWTQDLSAQRGRFIGEINRRFGSEVVTEIRFRQTIGPFPTADQGRPARSRAAEDRAADDWAGEESRAEEMTLSPEELAGIERTVAEIQDPEIREAARRAMVSQLKWRDRQKAQNGSP